MSLQRLSGGDSTPQERTVIVDTGSIARPVVEVVELDDTTAALHVVEPVYIDVSELGITLDELADVTVPVNLPEDVPLVLQRDDAGVYVLREMPPIELPSQSYRHDQIVASTLWQIQHGLGYRPGGVEVTDYDGSGIEPDKITRPLPNVVEVTFGKPVAGIAWLS